MKGNTLPKGPVPSPSHDPHPHPLKLLKTDGRTGCSVCTKKTPCGRATFHCFQCRFEVCQVCAQTHTAAEVHVRLDRAVRRVVNAPPLHDAPAPGAAVVPGTAVAPGAAVGAAATTTTTTAATTLFAPAPPGLLPSYPGAQPAQHRSA